MSHKTGMSQIPFQNKSHRAEVHPLLIRKSSQFFTDSLRGAACFHLCKVQVHCCLVISSSTIFPVCWNIKWSCQSLSSWSFARSCLYTCWHLMCVTDEAERLLLATKFLVIMCLRCYQWQWSQVAINRVLNHTVLLLFLLLFLPSLILLLLSNSYLWIYSKSPPGIAFWGSMY